MQLSEYIYFFLIFFIWTPESRYPIVIIAINLTSIISQPLSVYPYSLHRINPQLILVLSHFVLSYAPFHQN